MRRCVRTGSGCIVCVTRMNTAVTTDRATYYEIAGQPRFRSRRSATICTMLLILVAWNNGKKKEKMTNWHFKFRTFRRAAARTLDIWDASKRAIICFWRRNRSAKLTAVPPFRVGGQTSENRPLLREQHAMSA